MPEFNPWVEHLSVAGLLALGLTAFMKGWVVPRAVYRQALKVAEEAQESRAEAWALVGRLLEKVSDRRR